MWQDGALARLKIHEPIDKLLYNNYSTISLGYAGLYECVKYMTGHSHSDGGTGEKFGLEVMQALNDKCNKWKKEENIGYSVYGSPIESTTYKFAKCLKNRFGIIKDITDNPICCNPAHLRFDTRLSNVREMHDRERANHASKLSAAQVVTMRQRRAAGARQKDLAEQFGITDGQVSMIVRGLRWANAGGPIESERKYVRG